MHATLKKSKTVLSLKRQISNENGNIAFIAGIAAMPIMIALGAAVDFENTSNQKVKLQSAADSAALYAATLPAQH